MDCVAGWTGMPDRNVGCRENRHAKPGAGHSRTAILYEPVLPRSRTAHRIAEPGQGKPRVRDSSAAWGFAGYAIRSNGADAAATDRFARVSRIRSSCEVTIPDPRCAHPSQDGSESAFALDQRSCCSMRRISDWISVATKHGW